MGEPERSARALLRVADVTHAYGDRAVLHGVSLAVVPGECVALVGPNGCGKSTLLRLAAGREQPTTGRVEFGGAVLDEDDPATRARIATVLDAAVFYPDLTVREHLLFVALAHGLGAGADAAVDHVLDQHHLTEHADALPGTLSSGQTQALLLASAFVRPHELLVLDEPEQRLDSRARAELADRLRAHTARGVAVLLATHDPHLAHHAADRTLALESGHLAPTPPERLAQPRA
ncbi:ABC transporter ATP-binding protein [Streptomyces sp. JJ66]|uniref:ABC transporter ATP-binding protein n=1 Tax=Streptomyces sp. JJ66 TaxID=2803843 RepID=UPI001C5905AB|nr:ABC transporter ATP-binding protein [Streptomyces sp. JJ66]MBW1602650.1 ABC transporter ATP-binding protein [Streptomyces sp. JJ66]